MCQIVVYVQWLLFINCEYRLQWARTVFWCLRKVSIQNCVYRHKCQQRHLSLTRHNNVMSHTVLCHIASHLIWNLLCHCTVTMRYITISYNRFVYWEMYSETVDFFVVVVFEPLTIEFPLEKVQNFTTWMFQISGNVKQRLKIRLKFGLLLLCDGRTTTKIDIWISTLFPIQYLCSMSVRRREREIESCNLKFQYEFPALHFSFCLSLIREFEFFVYSSFGWWIAVAFVFFVWFCLVITTVSFSVCTFLI